MALRLYADRVAERRQLLQDALERVVLVCRAETEVLEAFVFGSFATGNVGPRSDLDVLVIRETTLGLVDRVADLKLASRSAVGIDLVVVTPLEYATSFRASSFGRTVIAQARHIYAS